MRHWSKFIVSFCLLITVFAFGTLSFVNMTLLNVRSYTLQLEDEEVFDRLKTSVDEGMGQLARYTNVPEEALTSAYDEASLKDFAEDSYEAMVLYLKGERNTLEISYPSESLYNGIAAAVQQYAQNSNVPYDAALESQVQSITDMAVTAINSYVMIIDPTLMEKTGILEKVQAVLGKLSTVIAVTGLVAVILILILWLINKHHRMRTFWWTGSAFTAAGLMMLIPGLVLKLSGLAGQFGSRDLYSFMLIEKTLESFLTKWCVWGLMIIVLGAILMVTYVLWRKRKIERAHDEAKKAKEELIRRNTTGY